MKRRDLLKYTALATGAAVGAPLLSSLLTGCEPGMTTGEAADELHFFTAEEFTLVRDLVDVILPKTDSPSASEVGVHHMIDAMVGTVYREEDRAAYRKGFAALAQYLGQAAGGKDFTQLTPEEKLQALRQTDGPEEVRKALLDFKQQTIAYYLTTEAVATNFLNYLPIPGAYDACIELSEVEGGKAWHYEL